MVLGGDAIHHRTRPAERLSDLTRPAITWADARIDWVALVGAFALVFALYGRSLRFAFFFDDTFDLTRTEGRSYWSLLASSEGYSYYRPIPFLFWKLFRQVQGHYDPLTLHILPLVAHALAGWLLFLLLRRLRFGNWGLLPALLFLTYPFDYQSVAIVGTLFHPLAGAAMLSALVVYQTARTTTNRRKRITLHCAALALTAVALWSHESGIVLLPLLAGLEALTLWKRGANRPSPWVSGHFALGLLFLIAWYSVEKTPFPEQTDVGELHPKGMFLLQAFTYPFSAQIGWVGDHIGRSPGVLQVGSIALIVVFGAYGVAGWRSGARGWSLARALVVPSASVAIACAAFAPALVRLSYSYVEDSPRLFYLVGIGASLFWGLLPSLDFRHERATRIWRIATCLLIAGVVAQSSRFVDVRMDMFERGTQMIDAVVSYGERYRGQRALVVNAPAWFSQDRYEYPYGHFGVQLMPSYIGLDRVIYTSSRYSAFTDAASATWNPDVTGAVYPFGPHGATTPPEQLDALLREGREVIDVRPRGTAFIVRDVGRLVEGSAEQRRDFPGAIASTIWISPARTAITTEGLTILYAWHVTAPLIEDANAVLEVRNSDGETIASYHGYPLAGFSAPRLWTAGDRVDDSLQIPVPPAGEYSIWLGLNRVSDGTANQVITSGGKETLDDGMLRIGTFVVP